MGFIAISTITNILALDPGLILEDLLFFCVLSSLLLGLKSDKPSNTKDMIKSFDIFASNIKLLINIYYLGTSVGRYWPLELCIFGFILRCFVSLSPFFTLYRQEISTFIISLVLQQNSSLRRISIP